MKRTVCSTLLVLVLIVGGAGCSNSSDDDGDGSAECNPRNTVDIETGHGSENGECTQQDTIFQVGTQVCGCTSWACVDDGDVLEIEWDNPVNSNDHVDKHTVDVSRPVGYDLAYCHDLAATGEWSLKVRRNGNNAGTRVFRVVN